MKCAGPHRIGECGKATDGEKKAGLVEMRRSIKEKKKKATTRREINAVNQIECIVIADIEDYEEENETDIESDVDLDAIVYDDDSDVEPIMAATEVKTTEDERRIIALDCGAVATVGGAANVKQLATAMMRATGETPNFRGAPERKFKAVGGGKLKSDMDVCIPLGGGEDGYEMTVHVLEHVGAKEGPNQPVLVGLDTMEGAAMIVDFFHGEYVSLKDKDTSFSREGELLVLKAKPKKLKKMRNGHRGIDLAEFGASMQGAEPRSDDRLLVKLASGDKPNNQISSFYAAGKL
jgi:hypothetical protein